MQPTIFILVSKILKLVALTEIENNMIIGTMLVLVTIINVMVTLHQLMMKYKKLLQKCINKSHYKNFPDFKFTTTNQEKITGKIENIFEKKTLTITNQTSKTKTYTTWDSIVTIETSFETNE